MTDYETLRARHAAEFQALMPEHLERLTWSRERVREEQLRGLRATLRFAKERSPWYAQRLAHIDTSTVTVGDLTSIPPMTKDDLMANFDAILTDRVLSRELVESHLDGLTEDAYLLDQFHVVASGGSSGKRGVFVFDWDGWLTCMLAMTRFRRRGFFKAGLGPSDLTAQVAGGKASHMTYAQRSTFGVANNSVSVPASLPIAEIVARLNELQPAALGGYPSAISSLAMEASAGRLRISPRFVNTGSEPLLSESRAMIEQAWGRQVMNIYGTSEGASASSCGEGPGMHLNEDVCIFEPVNDEGRLVPPGERASKVYITRLYNHVQPLIRYEMTDEVTLLDEDCPCGSGLRLIADIGGRSDDVFTYPGGLVVHPITFRSPLGRERNVIEYQVRQTQNGAQIDLRAGGQVDLESLRLAIQRELQKLGLKEAEVSLRVVDGFERLGTGKLKRFFPL
jgi:phenylacetate-coenzyme A ligase PaaK-like adenylate-forming protein